MLTYLAICGAACTVYVAINLIGRVSERVG